MTPLEIFCVCLSFILFVCLLRAISSPVDDDAAGVCLGQSEGSAALRAAADLPTPDLLATQCMTCRCVRCADRRWLPEAMVPLPVGCRVSHGLCPACERHAHAELDRCLPARSRNLQVALPAALPAAG